MKGQREDEFWLRLWFQILHRGCFGICRLRFLELRFLSCKKKKKKNCSLSPVWKQSQSPRNHSEQEEEGGCCSRFLKDPTHGVSQHPMGLILGIAWKIYPDQAAALRIFTNVGPSWSCLRGELCHTWWVEAGQGWETNFAHSWAKSSHSRWKRSVWMVGLGDRRGAGKVFSSL